MENNNYYSNMKNMSEKIEYSKKSNLGHHIATPIAMKLNENYSKGKELLAFGMVRERYFRGQENLPKGPAIYVANHSGVSDVSNLYGAIKRHFYILADANQLHEKDTSLFNGLIGCVYVKRCLTDEEEKLQKEGKYTIPEDLSGQHAKLFMINRLLNYQNCAMFIEGTWNTSYDELMLPTKWGAVDVAIAAEVPIVPINIEYLYDLNKSVTTVLKPIYAFPTDDKAKINEKVRQAIADNRIIVREEFYGKGKALGHYSKAEWDEIQTKNFMAYPDFPVYEELKCVYCQSAEEFQKRKEQYDHVYTLQQEAKRRVLILEKGVKK